MRIFASVLFVWCTLASSLTAAPEGIGLLWRAVQSCLLNHDLTGASFPCETVDISSGRDKGFAVIRAPLDDAHVIVMPTVRTIGIEADRLRGGGAPNYFQQAWLARRFAAEDLAKAPGRDDYALAVNSRLGRSQDQLHIHVACVRSDVKQLIDRDLAAIRDRPWSRIKPFSSAPFYRALFVPGDDLSRVNVVDLVAHGLDVTGDTMDDVTIAVVGMKPNGFVVLARKRLPYGHDQPHAEFLLDRACSGFAKRK